MSAVVVLLMVVVLLAFALGVVVLVAILLRRESDKVRAARGESDPSVEPDPSVEQVAKRPSVETTGDAETGDTQPVPTGGFDTAQPPDTP